VVCYELSTHKRFHLLIFADFDPEEDRAVESNDDEGSDSQESNDERLGTEHYIEIGQEAGLRAA